MKDLKGTKTEQNLKEAFAGESMARSIFLTGKAGTGKTRETDVYARCIPRQSATKTEA